MSSTLTSSSSLSSLSSMFSTLSTSSISSQSSEQVSKTLTHEERKERRKKMKKISDAKRYVLNKEKIREKQSIYYRKEKEKRDREFFEEHGEMPPEKNLSKFEFKWRDICKKLFPDVEVEYNHKELPWLVNPKTGRKLEIDIYFPQYKVGIEVQGDQHLKFVPFIQKTYKRFEDQIYRDCAKRILCQQNDVILIEIFRKDDKYIKIKEITDALRSRGGV